VSQSRLAVLRRLDVKELAFGLFLIALALVAFAATSALNLGTAGDMGPGFVPHALAWIILGFGVAFTIISVVKTPDPPPVLSWRPLTMILTAIALFAVLFSTLGLIAACMGTVLVAGAARTPVPWLPLLFFGAVLALFAALLFVKGLGLPLQLWPW
jgi:hypothetical protein